MGQSTVIGLGDDVIIGTDFCPLLEKFMADDATKAIVLIGKADNAYELQAAEYYAKLAHKKPVIAFVAGESLPFASTMGYAADILTHGLTSVQDKKKVLSAAGMTVVDRMNFIHQALADLHLND